MLTELCKELNNWFDVKRFFGTFTIENGTMKVDGAQVGQYVRICDSVFNDGIYQYPLDGLYDETFDGAVWLLAIPKDVIDLSSDVDNWINKYSAVMHSPYQSESFGGYSYTKASASNTSAVDGTSITWQSIFADKLSHWRKI